MPKAPPKKVRENCVRQFLLGLDTSIISVFENVSERSVERYIQRWYDTATLLSQSELQGDQRGRPAIVTADDLHNVCVLWSDDPTLFVYEVADIISTLKGTFVSRQCLSYWIKKLGITRKKLWKYAREASIELEYSFWYHLHRADYHINQFLWLDESHVNDKTLNRSHGWQIKGERAVFRQLFGRGTRYTVSAAIDCFGIVDYVVFRGSCTAHLLFKWMLYSLGAHTNPFPQPHSIIVLDNASIHKYEPFLELCRLFDVRILYLPPYSPHLNPIEQFFNILKSELRKYRVMAYLYPVQTLRAILEKYKRYNVMGSIRNAGYLNFCRH